MRMRRSAIVVLLAVAMVGCVQKADDQAGSSKPSVRVVASGLMNPSGVSISPDGLLTICDSGHGRVVLLRDGKIEDYVTGFDTEYWKPDPEGKNNRFKLGPLSAVWIDKTLVVSDGGKKDGRETLLFFDKAGKAADGRATTTLVPAGVPVEKGEGNLTGMAPTADGKMIYLCGQGSDLKSWIVACDVEAMALKGFASADDHDIAINSPMQVLNWDEDHILALYSGKGGTEDGLLVRWNKKSATPAGQWTLPGLVDPMGMARVPGGDDLVVVDNNWSLTKVNPGKVARVTLGAPGAATVKVLDVATMGPVSCVFGPEGKLYIAQLGEMYDQGKGEVLEVSGL